MEELLKRKLVKESSEKELEEFVHLLLSAKAMPSQSKPSKSSWMIEDKVKRRIESLEAYALDACKNDEQRKTAGSVIILLVSVDFVLFLLYVILLAHTKKMDALFFLSSFSYKRIFHSTCINVYAIGIKEQH